MSVKRIEPLTQEELEQISPEALRSLLKIIEARYEAVVKDTPQIPGEMTWKREEQWKANIDTLNYYSYAVRTLEDILSLQRSNI